VLPSPIEFAENSPVRIREICSSQPGSVVIVHRVLQLRHWKTHDRQRNPAPGFADTLTAAVRKLQHAGRPGSAVPAALFLSSLGEFGCVDQLSVQRIVGHDDTCLERLRARHIDHGPGGRGDGYATEDDDITRRQLCRVRVQGPGSSPTTADCPADMHRTSDRRPTGQSVQRRCGQVADDRGAVQLGIRSIHQHHMPMPWQHGFVLFGRSVRPRQSTITTPSFFSRRSCRTVVPCRRTSARWNTAGRISRCSLVTPIRHPVFARDDARPPDVDSWKYVHKLSIRPAEA